MAERLNDLEHGVAAERHARRTAEDRVQELEQFPDPENDNHPYADRPRKLA